jgi:hypothetical protein
MGKQGSGTVQKGGTGMKGRDMCKEGREVRVRRKKGSTGMGRGTQAWERGDRCGKGKNTESGAGRGGAG